VVEKPRAKLEKDEDGQIVEVAEVPANLTIDLQASNLTLTEVTTDQELSSKVYWSNHLQELLDTAKLKGYKPGWIRYRLAELNPPLEVWEQAGRALGYKPGWAWNRYRETMQKIGDANTA
jgi:hypothetical protein